MTSERDIGPIRAWALAAGDMVGGGIYISLGVVIEAAGAWAWLSFIIAGLAALISSHSYGSLSNHFESGGGSFKFIEQMKWCNIAGSLSWMLIIGYTLTISVYSYAFGRYVAHSLGGGQIVIRVLAVGIAGLLIGLNLVGAGKLTGVEVVIVTGNLIMLLVLAGPDPTQARDDGDAVRGVDDCLSGAVARGDFRPTVPVAPVWNTRPSSLCRLWS